MKKLLFGAVLLGGCLAQPGADSPDVTNVPRITLNSLTPGALASTQLTTRQLTPTSAAAMGNSQDARNVLAYAVSCALGPTQSIAYTAGGVSFAASGSIGLAKGWTTTGLSAIEAGWVSACILARVNLTATPVSISAQGATPALAITTAEQAAYGIEEGAFWGNAFIDLGAAIAYSCDGVDQARDDSYGDLPVRQCAQPDGVAGSNLSPCGMHYAGLCSAVCGTSGPYASCAFQGGPVSTAVVTTFLEGAP
jgi:hypothetical protein